MQDTQTTDAAVAKMRAAYARMRRTVELRPERATGTARTSVRVQDGTTCEVTEGDWSLTVDLPERWGGNGRGPNPGVYGRAALGSCLAIAYRRWAAEHDLPITSLEIGIEADYDARGELGLAEVTPGYTEVRYTVTVVSDAPAEDVQRVFDLADRRCPYLAIWRDPVPLRRELRIEAAS